MNESWHDLLCRVYHEGYTTHLRERDYDPTGNEVLDDARIRAESMEVRIEELVSINAELYAALDRLYRALVHGPNINIDYWVAAAAAMAKARGESDED